MKSLLAAIRELRKIRLTPSTGKTRIVVSGVRGFPNVEGGVETHCAHLYPRLVDNGFEIILLARAAYVGKSNYEYQGVKIVPLWAPMRTGLEAMVHTFIAVLVAKYLKAKIIHIHAIGPAIFTPLARMLGMQVVITHHGPDYDRAKWGFTAKQVLKLGESLGVRYANKVIVISKTIKSLVEQKYRRFDSIMIPNGVNIPKARVPAEIQSTLAAYQLKTGEYILSVGRLVPEKCFHDVIMAMQGSEKQVVIAGSIKDPTAYSKELRRQADAAGAMMAGFVVGESLSDLYFGASLFVLASTHEGLPIALLEAMSHGIKVLVSDIPANLEIGLPEECYFKVGDIEDLRAKAEKLITSPPNPDFVKLVMDRYDWDLVARQVAGVYESGFA